MKVLLRTNTPITRAEQEQIVLWCLQRALRHAALCSRDLRPRDWKRLAQIMSGDQDPRPIYTSGGRVVSFVTGRVEGLPKWRLKDDVEPVERLAALGVFDLETDELTRTYTIVWKRGE